MYKTSRVHQEVHYLPSQIKPVTTSANPLLAPGMDLGQPEPGSTIQWLIFRGGQDPPHPPQHRGWQRLLTPVATQPEQPREEKAEEHQKSSKQGGLMQKGGTPDCAKSSRDPEQWV